MLSIYHSSYFGGQYIRAKKGGSEEYVRLCICKAERFQGVGSTYFSSNMCVRQSWNGNAFCAMIGAEIPYVEIVLTESFGVEIMKFLMLSRIRSGYLVT